MTLIQTIQTIDESALNALIVETYGRPFCFQQQDFEANDSLHWVEVFPNDEHIRSLPEYAEFEAWRDRDVTEPFLRPDVEDRRKIYAELLAKDHASAKFYKDEYIRPGDMEWNMHWEREYYPPLNMLLGDLCERGLIPEGEYQIHVSW